MHTQNQKRNLVIYWTSFEKFIIQDLIVFWPQLITRYFMAMAGPTYLDMIDLITQLTLSGSTRLIWLLALSLENMWSMTEV